METFLQVLFAIISTVFAIVSCIFGVNRNRNSRLNSDGDLRNSGSGLDKTLHDYSRLERDKDRIQELDERDADNITECAKISERIRKREPETNVTE